MALISPLLQPNASSAPLDAARHKDVGGAQQQAWEITDDVVGKPLRLRAVGPITRGQISFGRLHPQQGRPRLFTLSSTETQTGWGAGAAGGAFTLLMRDEGTGELCVADRVGDKCFALIRLVGGLSEADFCISTPIISAQRLDEPVSTWWQRARLPPALEDGQQRPRKRIKLDMACPLSSTPQHPAPTLCQAQNTPEANPQNQIATISSAQHFEALISQYLDALYLSRTSLAFFTKGPLSRIRAASTSLAADLDMTDLTLFLRTMIIPLNALDKKFKEKLPVMADELAMKIIHDDDDDDDAGEGKPKRKKTSSRKKKLKLGREGMYPFEDEYVQKWWRLDDEPMGGDELREELVKRRVGELRIRQTLIQIVLILEIMALEASAGWKQASEAKQDATTAAKTQEPAGPTKRARKPQDLGLALDLLVDKLSIWQSVELDASRPARESQRAGASSSGAWNKDQLLSSFCVDVLIPFYKSRVPDRAVQMIKRFDGPNGASPEKQHASGGEVRRSSKQHQSTVTKGEAKDAKKQIRKPLSRSESQSHLQSRTTQPKRPNLSRSMTELSAGIGGGAIPPRIKREPSEARSLSSIPSLHDSKGNKAHRRRDSMASLKLLQSRQISLAALNGPADRKRRREAAVEDELRNAIDSIKKPNRSMVGRQVVDEREKRRAQHAAAAAAAAGARVGKRAGAGERRVLGGVENVQVLATPHHNRTTHVFPHVRSLASLRDFNTQPTTVPGSSSAIKSDDWSQIPATESKPLGDERQQPHLTPAHVLQTPSKPAPQAQHRYSLHSSPPSSGKLFGDGGANNVPDSASKRIGFLGLDAGNLLASSPVAAVPASTVIAKQREPGRPASYARFSFGRPLPPMGVEDGAVAVDGERLLAVPATPVKRASM